MSMEIHREGVVLGGAILLLQCVALTGGFGTGAPPNTCWTRYPKHNNLGTQTDPCPFTITLNPPSYKPSQEIAVTISGPPDTVFAGFQMAAFRTDAGHAGSIDLDHTEEPVGQWTSVPDGLRAFTCFPGAKNMVTHSEGRPRNTVTMTWTAPNVNAGDLLFRATIVQDFEHFWTRENISLPVHGSVDPSTFSEPTYPAPTLNEIVNPVEFSGCGDTKCCLYYPRHCSGDNCIAAVSFEYRTGTDDLLVEMFSDRNKNYVALGFSDDRTMGGEETFACINQDGMMSLQHGRNPGYYNERLLLGDSMTEQEIRQADGRLQCRFVIQSSSTVYHINQSSPVGEHQDQIFDRNQSWYLQMAWGKTMPDSNVMKYHKEMPVISDEEILVKIPGIHKGSAYHDLVRAHVGVMVVAWVFLSGIVTVVARHYRNWLGEKRPCGTKVWFQVHRGLAILVAVLTAIGLFLIFANFDWESEIREKAVPHAYLGLGVTAGVGLQLLAGMLRPGPDSGLRSAFNWGHRFLGHATHVLAAVTMFFAFEIEYVTPDMRQFGFITLGVWVAVQLLCHVGFEVFAWRHKNTSFDVSGTSGEGFAVNSSLLALYIIVLAGLAVSVALAFLLY